MGTATRQERKLWNHYRAALQLTLSEKDSGKKATYEEIMGDFARRVVEHQTLFQKIKTKTPDLATALKAQVVKYHQKRKELELEL